MLAAKPDLSSERSDAELLKVIDKAHRNLGHPPTHDLVRILKHAQASERAISLAQKHQCALCRSQIKPHVPLPAKTSRPKDFNQCVGIDVKNLCGWLPNQKIKAVNIVDQASCYQLMVPFYGRETSEVIQKIFSEHWVRIFGTPKEVILDQAQTNMGAPFQSYLDSIGTHVHQIAGEAHWQLGRTESHGGWFERVLQKTLSEFPPGSKEDWEQCVTHSHVKNTMIQSYGYTPHQYVFGRNPDVPSDLLSEPLHVVPATASLSDEGVAKAQAIRSAARKAVIETQDDLALRRAFSARPRLHQAFSPGDLVAYWRFQKFHQGQVVLGGQWYGTAIVIGNVGRNYIIAHRRNIFRAAPEQLRPATSEERQIIQTPQVELLGIKDMIDGGTFKSHQYIDLVPGHYPPMAEGNQLSQHAEEGQIRSVPDAKPEVAQESEVSPPPPPDRATVDRAPADSSVNAKTEMNQTPDDEVSENKALPDSTVEHSPAYGPVRRRTSTKSGPMALFRPAAMREDDFTEMMKEVIPRLIEQATNTSSSTARSSTDKLSDADMTAASKRALEESDATESQPSSRLRTSAGDECLSVEDIGELHAELGNPNVPIDVLL